MNRQVLQEAPLAKGKDIFNRTAKLGLYKECLALVYLIDDPNIRQHTLVEVQNKWRQNRGAGGYPLQLHIASCLDRVCYGRLCHSKARQRMLPSASLKYDWGVVNPLEYQTRVMQRREERQSPDAFNHGRGNRDFVPMTNWGYGNMDPDAITKHQELLDRQFFMGPHWRDRPKPVPIEDLSFEEELFMHFQPKPKMRKTPKKNF